MSMQPVARLTALFALASSAFAQHTQATPTSTSGGAPEIDVALAGAAVALVLGGLFIFTAARRAKLARS